MLSVFLWFLDLSGGFLAGLADSGYTLAVFLVLYLSEFFIGTILLLAPIILKSEIVGFEKEHAYTKSGILPQKENRHLTCSNFKRIGQR